MPLVRLSGSYDRAALGNVADAVHEAMVSHLDVPPDDVFRVIDTAPEGAVVANNGYLGIERRRPIFVEITLRRGRTDDAKRAFYQAVAKAVVERGTMRPEDLLCVLHENDRVDWSFGNGMAQYAPGAKAAERSS